MATATPIRRPTPSGEADDTPTASVTDGFVNERRSVRLTMVAIREPSEAADGNPNDNDDPTETTTGTITVNTGADTLATLKINGQNVNISGGNAVTVVNGTYGQLTVTDVGRCGWGTELVLHAYCQHARPHRHQSHRTRPIPRSTTSRSRQSTMKVTVRPRTVSRPGKSSASMSATMGRTLKITRQRQRRARSPSTDLVLIIDNPEVWIPRKPALPDVQGWIW